jgi:type VI secretion system VasD/TssJ family lipoprotein
MTKLTYLSALSIMFLLGGCFSQEVEVPVAQPQATTLDIAVIASETSTPMAVHFFALESDEQFKRLDYFELMKKKQSKLNGDIVAQSKKILLPGEMEKRSIKVDKNIRYYAIVAGFKDVNDNDNWRYIQEIIPENKNDITLILSQNHMTKVNK